MSVSGDQSTASCYCFLQAGDDDSYRDVQAKSESQYMEWMGHLQSHHAYRKHQGTLGSAGDGIARQGSPSVASPPTLFAGTDITDTTGRPTLAGDSLVVYTRCKRALGYFVCCVLVKTLTLLCLLLIQ